MEEVPTTSGVSPEASARDERSERRLLSALRGEGRYEPRPAVNLREIKELIKIVHETDITELRLENAEGTKVLIRKGHPAPLVSAPLQAVAPLPTAPAVPAGRPTEPPAPAAQPPADGATEERYVTVTAPMVGTFYRAPAPDAEPFVKVGDLVEVGQTLCIIEAMKLMNEIESEVRGRIVRILAENGQPVEYGHPLFLIEPV